MADRAEVLLTGATGFVGRRLAPALAADGWGVACVSRDAQAAAERWPERTWLEADLSSPRDLMRILSGRKIAYYLVHSIGEAAAGGLARREAALAGLFTVAARRAGVERIVYLGGIAPRGQPSPHLESRLAVGRRLREGLVPVVELRAAMIVGYGSTSWLMVRDLAARLPLMILPRWLESRSQPVAIDDVVTALVAAARLPLAESLSYDLPGRDLLSGREILERTAALLGHRHLPIVEVPVLSPRLSALWVRLVTRANWPVARELVVGLEHDLIARNADYWRLIGHPKLISFDAAAAQALASEQRFGRMRPAGRVVELAADFLTAGDQR